METRIHQAPFIYRRPKRNRFYYKWLLILACIIIISYLALFFLIVPIRPNKPFFNSDNKPLIIAHRGGGALAPENTLVAFGKSRELGVDIIEYDIHLTKDAHIVIMHDDSVDRTTNGRGKIIEQTLETIKVLDAAYTYKDIKGRYIYRDQGVKVPTLEEVFQQFPNIRHSIEIKKPDGDQFYDGIEQKLWYLIEKYGMEDKVLVTSEAKESIDRFQKYATNKVAVGGSRDEAQRFIIYHKLFLNRLYKPGCDVFQLPMQAGLFHLDDKRLIEGASTLNMPIYFSTINEETEMRQLLSVGANGIITDRPDLLLRVLKEMRDFND